MRKLSQMIRDQRNCEPYFPIIGVDGYGGEQDGSYVVLNDNLYHFSKAADADVVFPDGVPDHVHVHWSRYTPFDGWEVCLGHWSNQCPDDWTWPAA